MADRKSGPEKKRTKPVSNFLDTEVEKRLSEKYL